MILPRPFGQRHELRTLSGIAAEAGDSRREAAQMAPRGNVISVDQRLGSF